MSNTLDIENKKIADQLALSNELKKKLPQDLDISEIGKINLFEAEEIANEEIMILTEKDFLEDLENLEVLKFEKHLDKHVLESLPEENEVIISEKDDSLQVSKDIESEVHDELPQDDQTEIGKGEIFLLETELPKSDRITTENDNAVNDKLTSDHIDDTAQNFIPEYELERIDDIIYIDDEMSDTKEDDISKSKDNSTIYSTEFRDLESVPSKLKTRDKGTVVEPDNVADFALLGDGDIEFIDNSIIKDDFGRFILEIDDYTGFKNSGQSEAEKLYGIETDELKEFENQMFSSEYEKQQYNDVDAVLSFFERSGPEEKHTKYISNDEKSFDESEIISIESDITSANAIVIEEDVSDIYEELEIRYGSSDVESHSYSETLTTDANVESEIHSGIEEYHGTDDGDIIIDITDSVIILEDYAEREKFTDRFPDKKEDLNKLFTYLDGLFEKLPEDVIMKFADSEYFDLYMKVINEMD